jgi:hypothetical protein
MTQEQRQKVIQEIVQTEQTYVQDLLILKHEFMDPLKDILSLQEINMIFSYLGSILTVHQELVKKIANPIVFLEMVMIIDQVPYFKVYILYVTNFDQSIKTLEECKQKNEKCKQFLLQSRVPLGLEAYLLTPVQRIPRYKLLLSELIKHTPIDDPEYELLQKAHSEMDQGMEG